MENKEEIVTIKGEKWRMTMIDAPDYTEQPDKIGLKLNFEYKLDLQKMFNREYERMYVMDNEHMYNMEEQ
jgi:hypothetical protein